MTKKHCQAERWGRFAELFAALFLRLKGYRVLARRVRSPMGEVDLIARKGDYLIFVEVKARRDFQSLDWALTPHAQARITRAAHFLWKRYHRGVKGARLDIVLICPWKWPVHMKGAWLARH